jgi:predicted dinucleotide-binding enzyme
MSTISIIGTGNMARTIGVRAVAGGNAVEIMGRDRAKAADLAQTLGGGTTTGEWGAALAGDIVILALLYDGVVPAVAHYGEALAGKVVVDISNLQRHVRRAGQPRGDLDRAASRHGGPGERQAGEGVQHRLSPGPREGPARHLPRR